MPIVVSARLARQAPDPRRRQAMTPPPPASSSTSTPARTSVPVPDDGEVADVGAAASAPVGVGAPAPAATDAEPVVVAEVVPVADGPDVGDVVVTLPRVVLELEVVLPPPDGLVAARLAGRLVVVRGAGRVVVLDAGGRGCDGGRMAGGLPAPNAHPSTVPLFGCEEAAPTVLYDQEPPGTACQYDQYAVVGAPLQGSGRRSMVHTSPGCRGTYVTVWPVCRSTSMPEPGVVAHPTDVPPRLP
jgi:hypothetical protein